MCISPLAWWTPKARTWINTPPGTGAGASGKARAVLEDLRAAEKVDTKMAWHCLRQSVALHVLLGGM